MNTPLEQQLRRMYAGQAADYDPDPAAERLLGRRYHQNPYLPRVWATAGACCAFAGSGIAAAVILLSSGAAPAYAGWNAAGTQPAPGIVAEMEIPSGCNKHAPSTPGGGTFDNDDPPVFIGQPALTESRGIYTAIVSVTSGYVYACLADASAGNPNFAYVVRSFGAAQPAPPADLIGVPYTSRSNGGHLVAPTESEIQDASASEQGAVLDRVFGGGGYGADALGQAGSNVTAVSFSFADQSTVDATVENGWYFAWWPWTELPNAVSMTTSTGATTTSPVTGSWGPGFDSIITAGCQPGSGGCAFAAGTDTATTTTATATTTTAGSTSSSSTVPTQTTTSSPTVTDTSTAGTTVTTDTTG
jgi:hypothetical protein